jgi:Ca2+-binding RTX toxin-like protein
MRKFFLVIPVALTATLVLPSISKAQVPTCFGQPATIVGTERGDILNGTEGPDVIVGLGKNDNIHGLGGDDRICGNAGDEYLAGGEGNDQVKGGEGDDHFREDDGNDRLWGGPEDDWFSVADGDDAIVGGKGEDWFTADHLDGGWGDNVAGGVTLNLTTGESFLRKQPGGTRHSFGVDTISQVENLWGTRLNDILIGNNLNNHLGGGEGDDTLFGRGGNDRSNMNGADTFSGGSGNDRFLPGEGDQTIRGGPGSDWISYLDVDAYSVRGPVRVYLRRGIAKAHGTDRFAGIENVVGTEFHDILIGDSRANIIIGGFGGGYGGEDTLVGRGGNDLLKADDAYPRDSLDGGRDTDMCQADRRDIVTRCEASVP